EYRCLGEQAGLVDPATETRDRFPAAMFGMTISDEHPHRIGADVDCGDSHRLTEGLSTPGSSSDPRHREPDSPEARSSPAPAHPPGCSHPPGCGHSAHGDI